jgi:hypothetical protein
MIFLGLVIFVSSCVLLLLGLIKPSLVTIWGRSGSRGMVILIFVVAVAVSATMITIGDGPGGISGLIFRIGSLIQYWRS